MSYTIHSFYKFFPFPDYKDWKASLLAQMDADGMRGSILLAEEGLNATVSGTDAALKRLHAALRSIPRLGEMSVKTSQHETLPFGKAKVKLKRELISLGEPAHPEKRVGTYVPPKEWNALISSPDVITIDARNFYETHLGSFRGALDPKTRKFTQLPDFTRSKVNKAKQPRIATFCTGGIRCEKYTAWLLEQGFEEVYHLEGGILNYLETVTPEESLWEGSCYVFDERVAVGHGLTPDPRLTTCDGCGHPLTPEDRSHAKFVAGASCPHCEHYPPSNA